MPRSSPWHVRSTLFIPSGAGDANPAMSTRAPGQSTTVQNPGGHVISRRRGGIDGGCGSIELIETWADGHLLVVWVALWTVAFAALALLAPPLRQLSASLAAEAARWARLNAVRRDEAQLWDNWHNMTTASCATCRWPNSTAKANALSLFRFCKQVCSPLAL